MKLGSIFAAIGIAVAALGASAPAQAHDRWDDRRWSHDRRWDGDRRWDHDRRWDRDRRWTHDRRWANERRWYRDRDYRRRCWNEWNRGRKIRVCR